MGQTEERRQILLESGTNELEALVFSVGPTRYGVNVAKVREVIGTVDVVKVPKTHPAVVGVFKLREAVNPLVDLQLYFQPGVPSEATQRSVILMEFNDVQVGFLVDTVERIFRLSWKEMKPMPTVQSHSDSVITSVCETDGQLALMVDFEKIAFDINGDENVFKLGTQVAANPEVARGSQHLLLAEDSPTIRNAIESTLVKAGYVNVTATSDGAEAWSRIEASLSRDDIKPVTAVITDIEMPQMDGLHLCKRIKEDPRFKDVPVVVFSSLVSNSNLKKCKAVGADAAISKPQMTQVVALLDRLIAKEDWTDIYAEAEALASAT